MSVDPLSISQHVIDAGEEGMYTDTTIGFTASLPAAIAAALTALIGDDEPVTVPDRRWVDSADTPVDALVRPSDVFAAVLNRETDR